MELRFFCGLEATLANDIETNSHEAEEDSHQERRHNKEGLRHERPLEHNCGSETHCHIDGSHNEGEPHINIEPIAHKTAGDSLGDFSFHFYIYRKEKMRPY